MKVLLKCPLFLSICPLGEQLSGNLLEASEPLQIWSHLFMTLCLRTIPSWTLPTSLEHYHRSSLSPTPIFALTGVIITYLPLACLLACLLCHLSTYLAIYLSSVYWPIIFLRNPSPFSCFKSLGLFLHAQSSSMTLSNWKVMPEELAGYFCSPSCSAKPSYF